MMRLELMSRSRASTPSPASASVRPVMLPFAEMSEVPLLKVRLSRATELLSKCPPAPEMVLRRGKYGVVSMPPPMDR